MRIKNVENRDKFPGTLNRRRKQRQAEDLLKPNVCIPIVRFLYAVCRCTARARVSATTLCAALVRAGRPLLCAVHSRSSPGVLLWIVYSHANQNYRPINKIMTSVPHYVQRECNKRQQCVITRM